MKILRFDELMKREVKERYNKKKKGFTLIELIAVIAILGILAAILVPNIIGYTNKAKITKVKANAKTVLNIIKTAKAESTDPNGINNYTDAIADDIALKLTTVPNTNLASLTDTVLETIVDSKELSNITANAGSSSIPWSELLQ